MRLVKKTDAQLTAGVKRKVASAAKHPGKRIAFTWEELGEFRALYPLGSVWINGVHVERHGVCMVVGTVGTQHRIDDHGRVVEV